MVIDMVHGLQATGLSLNDRFTMLAEAPDPRPRTPRRRPAAGFNQNTTFRNKNFIEQIARRLEQQAKRQSLRQRLGVGRGGLRRFGSESSLPSLWRSNSFGNLSQRGVKSRLSWRQSNGNLTRSASFGNLSRGAWRARGRGLRRRGGRAPRARPRIGAGLRVRGAGLSVRGAGLRARGAGLRVRGAGRGRARGHGRGRGGILRNQNNKPVPTKEELDLQLDQYMASTKSALDAELDTYMKNAMELE